MNEEEMPLPMQGLPPYFGNDAEISGKLLSVQSKISTDKVVMEVMTEDGEKKIQAFEFPTNYHELLTEDASTAFCDLVDQSVLRSHELLCSLIKSFADSFGFERDEHGNYKFKDGKLVRKMDLSDCYNFLADYHNSLLVSSKSTGEAARTAKSQFFKQEQKGYFESREHRRKFFGLL